ncbi:hypothetical protein BVC80_1685g4 [Macleaya cordata]|uniref:Uncharacterized protein n=1 Tax=Macleaya cordata TaxID=56857 RepID=A0A200RAP6_MACCD|nr:hypothetical protein BVC80_1685g4 [Macleaya cordata]
MPRKRVPILERAMNLLKITFFVAKVKKPIRLKLILLRKQTRDFKKLIKHHHNHYSYIREYEFSPSNTPLFHYHRNNKLSAFKKQRCNICSLFFLCRPRSNSNLRIQGGDDQWEKEGEEEDYYVLEEVNKQIMDYNDDDDVFIRDEVVQESMSNFGEDEDDSIDRKAEMFIQRF